MSKRLAVVDYQKCHPKECGLGVCTALAVCPRAGEILVQESPGDYPYILQDLCRSCGDCSRACDRGAIRMVYLS